MTRIAILAALLLALPAAARAQDYPGDDDSGWQQDDQQPPQPQEGPTAADFENDNSLQNNGQWVDTPDYGQVWQPTGVSADWSPYTYGHWAYTDAGWAWVSDEPFGWAVYHYGRWGFSPDFGWYWVPGRVWAPAWVAWRSYGNYSGWSPLGPRGVVVVEPRRWVWVDHQHFMEPVYQHRVQPRALPQQGMPTPQRGPHAGPPVAVVERATGRQVQPLTVREASNPRSGQAGGGSVYFYRPHTAPVARPQQRPYFGGVPGPAYGGQPRNTREVQPQPQTGPRVQTYGPRPAPPPQSAQPVHPAQPQAQPVKPKARSTTEHEQPHVKEK